MRFNLIDKIVEVQAGVSLKALKNLTLGEEYLADHFPTFPVMPGVLMLQTLVEAGAWLLRISEDYAHSVIVLREAKNIKYGNFMEPGKQMLITVELIEKTADLAVFKGKGEMEGQSTVSARITLARYNLRDKDNSFKDTDEKMIAHYKELHRYLSMKA
ncbi:MAG: beta-hydroxyacyl-ACP dehydratase [Planctomycetota bacterium]|nr:hydroxymyristoyl-ACP dehydratase [Gemmataceae bacterium]MBJ7344412.1 hydroxymyristoyl-ACP dehydratase [Gemmataceae bacterium]MBJ7430750.1 hydroxymyristoyl-ACP dehydratase [Gemmataceae bacterium]RLS85552.1 MAG: beta-hydroxyacyl-ACP dehydratase [Planctomycetota bacterium]